ncbi:MAG: response regulator transcription factor [Dehalococcoidia bacterium]|nr:response regulator transcription factor [Dehalococcoidia bacterium]
MSASTKNNHERRIRVLIVDDHGILRAGITMLLQSQGDMELAGEATTGREAIGAADRLEPDVVLMDLSMPDLDGFEATKAIKARHPNIAVLALTMYDSEEHFFKALDAGASGYVPKRAASTDLLTAIRSAFRGDVFLYPSMAKVLLRDYLRRVDTGEERMSYDGLTDREQEVLRLIAEGRSTRDIADKLCIAVSTVERHRANIMTKLDLHNRTELIKYAIRKGLVDINPDRDRDRLPPSEK